MHWMLCPYIVGVGAVVLVAVVGQIRRESSFLVATIPLCTLYSLYFTIYIICIPDAVDDRYFRKSAKNK